MGAEISRPPGGCITTTRPVSVAASFRAAVEGRYGRPCQIDVGTLPGLRSLCPSAPVDVPPSCCHPASTAAKSGGLFLRRDTERSASCPTKIAGHRASMCYGAASTSMTATISLNWNVVNGTAGYDLPAVPFSRPRWERRRRTPRLMRRSHPGGYGDHPLG